MAANVSQRFVTTSASEFEDQGYAARPTIPAVLQVALWTWLSCACAFAGSLDLPLGTLLWCLVAGCVLSVVVLFTGRRVSALWWLLLAGVSLGVVLGLSANCVACWQISRYSGAVGEVAVQVTTDPSRYESGIGITGRLVEVDGSPVVMGPMVRVYGMTDSVRYGDRLYLTDMVFGSASPVLRQKGTVLSATVNEEQVVISPCFGILRPLYWARNTILERVSKTSDEIDGKQSALHVMEALICGYRTDLFRDDVYGSYKASGVAHIVAVSGAHLSTVYLLFTGLLARLKLKRKKQFGIQIVLVLLYLCFAAIPLSALRAATMVILAGFGFVAQRRPAALNALGLCILLVLISAPGDALSTSFLLSAGSTLGIVLFSPLVGFWMKKLMPFMPAAISDIVSITLSSMVPTALISVALFSQFSIVSVLANILITPFFALLCGGGLLSALLVLALPGLGLPVFGALVGICHVMNVFVAWCAGLPFACVPAALSMIWALLGSFALCAILWLLWPQPSLKGVLGVLGTLGISGLLVLVIGLSVNRVVMLDVGQGDAFLVQSRGRCLLIDTGDDPAKLKRALGECGVARLDGVVISHADRDHCGALKELSEVCGIGALYVAADMLVEESENCRELVLVSRDLGVPVYGLNPGDSIHAGNVTMEVLWPERYRFDGGNEDSLCLLLTVDLSMDGLPEASILFTGDLGAEQLEYLVDSGRAGDIDVLKVSHHGSRTGLSSGVLAALKPEFALISVGAGNRYGHPTDEVLHMLEDAGVETWRTDISGSVVVSLTGKGPVVREK